METNRYDAYREDRAGRANVADSPERVAYYQELARLETGALWTVANKIEPWAPRSASVPVVWRYQDLRGHVLRSAELVSPEEAGRRVIYLNNPGRRDVAAAVGWLYSGLQVMKPGELASAHAHSHSALRFIMEGSGACTIVDGHKMTLGANDFVLTPNGTWHEHGVSEDGTTCIWQDGLDIPLVNALEAGFYAVHPDLNQAVTYPVDDTTATWGGVALRPQASGWTKPYSPLFKYEWESTYEALRRYARVTAGSPYDGVLLEYVNPMTGGPVMPTIGASMQLLRPASTPRRTATPAASSTRWPRAAAIPSSRAGATTGPSATSSACRPGPCTSTSTCPRTTTPACSVSTICRSCARCRCTAKRRSRTTTVIRR